MDVKKATLAKNAARGLLRLYCPGCQARLQCLMGHRVATVPQLACILVAVVRIHTMNSKQVIKQLEADGWYLARVKGSHHQFKHPSKPGKVTVPDPKKDLLIATVRSILKQAGL